ncbi:hypothetical protein JYG30_06195 [Fibrella sp. USSR17]
MARAKGIQAHHVFKLGKRPARRDNRNLMFGSLLKAPFNLNIPDEYDFDATHSGIPTPMFANDRWGDCVIAGRAHQTLRFEMLEQKTLIAISDQDVVDEYLLESGGADNGLVMLTSLKRWRNIGWSVAGQQLNISAFAQIDPQNSDEVKRVIFMDVGCGIGLLLPNSARKQLDVGKPWSVTTDADSAPNSWGGHYVYISGYTAIGPVCVTWGRKHQMTWDFMATYCDEAYAIFDALNTKKIRAGLNVRMLTNFINANPPTAAPVVY